MENPQKEWRRRYQIAHEENFKILYPQAYFSGHYSAPVYPKVKTANGLTGMIVNYLNWCGHRATRINVQGRLIEGVERSSTGQGIRVKKWLKSSTRRGTADVSSTIKGKSVMWEVKVGRDRPSEDQLKEQAKERAAGGVYEFVHTAQEFFEIYDRLI